MLKLWASANCKMKLFFLKKCNPQISQLQTETRVSGDLVSVTQEELNPLK